MGSNSIYQVSTLQALALGYNKKVITAEELMHHGDTGLGTFEDVDGEMIALDGKCYKAGSDGKAEEVSASAGTPFCTVAFLSGTRREKCPEIKNINQLKEWLNVKIEEDFGLNSIHLVRIDGDFEIVKARSETPYKSAHVELKDMLSFSQTEFEFKDLKGSLVCVYFPDYMEGINAAGWHFHFISEDRKCGGHVFELSLKCAEAAIMKISSLEIQLPRDAAFDTYALKEASQNDIKKVEQGGDK